MVPLIVAITRPPAVMPCCPRCNKLLQSPPPFPCMAWPCACTPPFPAAEKPICTVDSGGGCTWTDPTAAVFCAPGESSCARLDQVWAADNAASEWLGRTAGGSEKGGGELGRRGLALAGHAWSREEGEQTGSRSRHDTLAGCCITPGPPPDHNLSAGDGFTEAEKDAKKKTNSMVFNAFIWLQMFNM